MFSKQHDKPFGSSGSKQEVSRNDSMSLMKSPLEIVILGSPKSGKSTMLTQLSLICKSYSYLEYRLFKPRIAGKILDILLQILKKMEESNVQLMEPKTRDMAVFYKAHLSWEGNKDERRLGEITRTMKGLWKDENLQNFFKKYMYSTSDEYFMNSLSRISSEKYLPSHEDVCQYLYDRGMTIQSTKSIDKIQGVYKNIPVNITAVNEEAFTEEECIRVMQESRYIVFCISLDDFDLLGEDGKTNKLDEAKRFLIQTVSIKKLENKPLLLLFTKRDLFEEKLKTTLMKKFFPDFVGKNNYKSALEFIMNYFFNDPEIKRRTEHCVFASMDICCHNRDEISKKVFSKDFLALEKLLRL